MLRKLLPLICLCCVCCLSLVTRAQEPEKVLVEEIKMNVSALTTDGRFVQDLKINDLVINEDGRLHQPNAVSRLPAKVLIMLDTGGTLKGNVNDTLSAAVTLIGSLGEGDTVSIFQISDTPQLLVDWTVDKAAAAETIRKKLSFGRRSGIYRALGEARAIFQKVPAENRHLVLITAGIDSFNDKSRGSALSDLLSTDINVHVISYTRLQKASVSRQKEVFNQGEWKPRRLPEEIADTLPDPKRPGPEDEREVTPREIAKMPRLGSVSVDIERTINARNRSKDLDTAESRLQELSADTNGVYLLPGSADEMDEKAAALAAIIGSQWVIAYTPKRPLRDAQPDEVRNVEVTSRRSGLMVQARRKLIVRPTQKN